MLACAPKHNAEGLRSSVLDAWYKTTFPETVGDVFKNTWQVRANPGQSPDEPKILRKESCEKVYLKTPWYKTMFLETVGNVFKNILQVRANPGPSPTSQLITTATTP